MIIFLLLLNTYIQPSPPGAPPRLSSTYWFCEDFISGTTASGNIGDMRWTLNAFGGGAYQNLVEVGRFGMGAISPGGTTTGWACLTRPIATYLLGNLVLETAIRFPLLSGTGNEYVVRFGLGDITTSPAEPNNGIYFRYQSTLSPNWQCIAANAGARTIITTTVPATINWTKFKFKVNAARTVVDMYINDTWVSQLTVNIPTTPPLWIFYKINKVSGTGMRHIYMDYIQVYADTDLNR